jgi:secreted Zn-dependent insulinase-like peptidase
MVAEAEIRKPGNDSREYRAVVLPNELRVLLVSDPDTDKVCAIPTSITATLPIF